MGRDGFDVCYRSGTRQTSLLCRVPIIRHTAKETSLPCATTRQMSIFQFYAFCTQLNYNYQTNSKNIQNLARKNLNYVLHIQKVLKSNLNLSVTLTQNLNDSSTQWIFSEDASICKEVRDNLCKTLSIFYHSLDV